MAERLPHYEASGFFVLRTPLLPWSAVAGPSVSPSLAGGPEVERKIERLRALVTQRAIREALFVASPSFDEAIDAWLADPSSARAEGVVDILVRYLARMAARPTPFGLFSGCTTGT